MARKRHTHRNGVATLTLKLIAAPFLFLFFLAGELLKSSSTPNQRHTSTKAQKSFTYDPMDDLTFEDWSDPFNQRS